MFDRLSSEQGGPHGLSRQLFVWGLARLMGGLAVLIPAILSPRWFGVEVGPALLAGGLVGLGSVLLQPGTLGRPLARLLGASLSPYQEQFYEQVGLLRKRCLLVVSAVPFLAGPVTYLLLAPPGTQGAGIPEYALTAFMVWMHVSSWATGVQYLQVGLALRRGVADDTSGS